jgi:hypothetical protein
MNRKNLTAAVLAGLAGAAGIAGTAQAVNINPDGLGSVLIYPYYTSNGGNQTLLSVVNTSSEAKAVKVRFLEGYNSREVLDFNMYMSAYDVWVAAIVDDGAGTPTLYIPDSTCTVPYLFEQDSDGDGVGEQPFLPYAYTGDYADGGPSDISRAAEGHFEMIEMGTLTNDTARLPTHTSGGRLGSAEAATHVVTEDGPRPLDCQQLVDNWTGFVSGPGMWLEDPSLDIDRQSGGLFGGAAVVNAGNGTMFSYDAQAIQGFDSSDHDLHFVPGTIHPALNDGNREDATVFFGEPLAEAVTLEYSRSIDAVSAVFMKENIMNEFNVEAGLNALSEWVITFPTKNFYVDPLRNSSGTVYIPNPADSGCNGWDPGEPFPSWTGSPSTMPTNAYGANWTQCTYIPLTVFSTVPFTSLFGGEACELAFLSMWDREESASTGVNRPPIVSPPPPGGSPSGAFTLCYETNVLRFGGGESDVPEGGSEIFGSSAATVRNVPTTLGNGWANINFHYGECPGGGTAPLSCSASEEIPVHRDWLGLIGLPVTGFWAEQFQNGFLTDADGNTVLANYGGLFGHKANIRRQLCPDAVYTDFCSSGGGYHGD